MIDENMVERVARAICQDVLNGTEYDEVPPAEVFSRPRYAFLAHRVRQVAQAAIEAMTTPIVDIADIDRVD